MRAESGGEERESLKIWGVGEEYSVFVEYGVERRHVGLYLNIE
jgi:hypothetical protein